MKQFFKRFKAFLPRLNKIELLVISAVALGHSLLLTSRALFSPETFAGEGDAWGVISDIYDMASNVHRRGLHILLGDLYRSDSLGVGVVTDGSPFGTIWKTMYWAVGSLFQATTAYDVLVFLCVLGAWAGAYYLLRRGAGLAILPSMAGAILVVSSDHIYTRTYAHLSFITIGAPLVMMAVALRFSQTPSIKRATALSFVIALTISLNEYLGYFGLYAVVAILLVGFIAGMIRHGWRFALQWPKPIGLSALLTVFLICTSYPHMTLGRFFSTGTAAKVATNVEHTTNEFWVWSEPHPWIVLTTKIKAVEAQIPALLTNQIQFKDQPLEMSNRVGFPVGFGAILISIWAFGFLFVIPARQKIGRQTLKNTARPVSPETWTTLTTVLIFAAVAVTGACLASHPTKGNLSYMTLLYARMFRVGSRALLYSQLGAIALWAILLHHWCRAISRFFARRSFIPAILLALGASGWFVLSWYDIQGGQWNVRTLAPFQHYKTPINDAMAALPRGLTLKLPFNFPYRSAPEADYNYRTSQIYDGQPLINGASQRQYHAALDLGGLVAQINHLPEGIISILEEAGVRYITFNPDFHREFTRLLNDPRFKVRKNDSSGLILELIRTSPVENARVLEAKIFHPKGLRYQAASMPSDELFKQIPPAWGPDPLAPAFLRYEKLENSEERLFSGLHFYQDPGRYQMSFEFKIKPKQQASLQADKRALRAHLFNDECHTEKMIEIAANQIGADGVARAVFDVELGAVCVVCLELTGWNAGEYEFDGVDILQH